MFLIHLHVKVSSIGICCIVSALQLSESIMIVTSGAATKHFLDFMSFGSSFCPQKWRQHGSSKGLLLKRMRIVSWSVTKLWHGLSLASLSLQSIPITFRSFLMLNLVTSVFTLNFFHNSSIISEIDNVLSNSLSFFFSSPTKSSTSSFMFRFKFSLCWL